MKLPRDTECRDSTLLRQDIELDAAILRASLAGAIVGNGLVKAQPLDQHSRPYHLPRDQVVGNTASATF